MIIIFAVIGLFLLIGGIAAFAYNKMALKRRECVVSDWGKWTKCSLECGGGVQTRKRTVLIPPENGLLCPPLKEDRSCNTNLCCEESTTPWTECSKTCGGGQRTRSRKYTKLIQTTDNDKITECVDIIETENCNTGACLECSDVPTWTEWSACSKTCGGGTQTRNKSVKKTRTDGTTECEETIESRECNTGPCPVDCVLSDWIRESNNTDSNGWSVCSKTCGGGVKTRKRNVKEPAKYGGSCPPLTETMDCNTDVCNTDCMVSDWKKTSLTDDFGWSLNCSTACGGGKRTRERIIITPQSGTGSQCPPLTEEKECNTYPCPDSRDCIFAESELIPWGACSTGCGVGIQNYTGTVTRAALDGGTCSPKGPCTRTDKCPVNCEVGPWGPWGACSVPCEGDGIKTRTRTIKTSPLNGGTSCPTLTEQRDCNMGPCPPRVTFQNSTTGPVNIVDICGSVKNIYLGPSINGVITDFTEKDISSCGSGKFTFTYENSEFNDNNFEPTNKIVFNTNYGAVAGDKLIVRFNRDFPNGWGSTGSTRLFPLLNPDNTISCIGYPWATFKNNCVQKSCDGINCGLNGFCSNGLCVCDTNYTGTNCQNGPTYLSYKESLNNNVSNFNLFGLYSPEKNGWFDDDGFSINTCKNVTPPVWGKCQSSEFRFKRVNNFTLNEKGFIRSGDEIYIIGKGTYYLSNTRTLVSSSNPTDNEKWIIEGEGKSIGDRLKNRDNIRIRSKVQLLNGEDRYITTLGLETNNSYCWKLYNQQYDTVLVRFTKASSSITITSLINSSENLYNGSSIQKRIPLSLDTYNPVISMSCNGFFGFTYTIGSGTTSTFSSSYKPVPGDQFTVFFDSANKISIQNGI